MFSEISEMKSLSPLTRGWDQSRKSVRVILLVLVVCVSVFTSFFALVSPCFASQPAPSQTVNSYWGPIPAPTDSTTSIFPTPPRSAWETTLLVPYRLIAFPFNLIQVGLKHSFIYLDDSGFIYRLTKLLGPRQGPFGLALRIKAGSLIGLGGGLSATQDSFFSPDNQLKFRWSSTNRGSHQVTLGLQFAKDKPTHTVTGFGYRLRPKARYFGIGSNTRETDESYYLQETSWAGISLRHKITDQFTSALTGIYSNISTRGTSDNDHISFQEIFPVSTVGFRDQSEGFTLSLALRSDSTLESGRPGCGGIRELKCSRFIQTQPLKTRNHDQNKKRSDFWSWRANFEQMIPLWLTHRTLAVRAHCTWLEPDHLEAMPFQRLLTNDDPDLLRGYRDFRWRDRGLIAFSAEYRWPLWSNKTNDGLGVDCYLFTDIGEVFSEFDHISSDKMTSSCGWGLRLIGNDGFLGRFEIGFSDEETVIRIRTDQIYQFSKGGLQHGRDQVALR